MSQSTQLIAVLKQALKAHGKTYLDVARYLSLSETSVKRLFSQKSFSLQRLDQVCQMIGIEFSDLLQMINESTAGAISSLSLEQEQEIVGDLELMLIAVCVLNRWSLDKIVENIAIPEVRCIQHLARLDRLKMIELLPRNRVKLRVAPNFQWLENGPIQQFFLQKLQSDFFNSSFDQEQERLIVINGMLGASSNLVFQRKMEHLARVFDDLNCTDVGLPFQQRSGTTVVLAMRRWHYGLFNRYQKKSKASSRTVSRLENIP